MVDARWDWKLITHANASNTNFLCHLRNTNWALRSCGLQCLWMNSL